MQFAWGQAVAGFLPLDLAIDQLPMRFMRNERFFQVAYKPIQSAKDVENDGFEKMLIVVSDVTAKVTQEKLEAEAREKMKIFQVVLHDKHGFLEFVSETGSLVSRLTARPGLVELKRIVHTVKGNSALYGLQSIAEYCHDWETRLNESGLESLGSDAESLSTLWNSKVKEIIAWIGEKDSNQIEIDAEEYGRALARIHGGADGHEIGRILASWKLESMASRLSRFRDLAQRLALRLGKVEVDIGIEHNFVRVDADRFAPFWNSLVHVIRNALDHGLETTAERIAVGKPAAGHLMLRTLSGPRGELIVEVQDDGGGINWDVVRAKAQALGLDTSTRERLESALFFEGLTTKDTVTDISGRGVGMGAVKETCEELGGSLSIETVRGQGTTFRFTFPAIMPLRVAA